MKWQIIFTLKVTELNTDCLKNRIVLNLVNIFMKMINEFIFYEDDK